MQITSRVVFLIPVVALLIGCTSGPVHQQRVAANTAEAPGAAARHALCVEPLEPQLRADVAAVFRVSKEAAQAEFCRRLDRAAAEGKINHQRFLETMTNGSIGDGANMLTMLASLDDGPNTRSKLRNNESVDLAPVSGQAKGKDGTALDSEARKIEDFFLQSVKLAHNFDPAITDLYSDTARIRATRLYPNGQKREMELSGAQFKTILMQSLPLAKSSDDKDYFSNMVISRVGRLHRIKADRYSSSKCYTDFGFYTDVEQQTDGSYKIVEALAETQPNSLCRSPD